MLAFDTETRGLDWFDPNHRAFLISWADETGSDHTTVDDEVGLGRFMAAVHRHDTLVAHNLPFDVHHVREATGIDLLRTRKRLLDTSILARVAIPERAFMGGRFGLKPLAQTYLGDESADAEEEIAKLAKQAGIKLKTTGGYFNTWRAYPKQVEHYARKDTELTHALWPVLYDQLHGDGARHIFELERDLQPLLIEAEQRGVAIDQAKVEPLYEHYLARAHEARAIIAEVLGPETVSGKGQEAALLAALDQLGIQLYRKTPTGDISTDRFALAEYEQEFPILQVVSDLRNAEKFLSTYIEPMRGRETVHPSFRQIGAWTGRMSCARPNMQNIPARAGTEVREMFIPRDGHCFVVCDFDSIEVRLLAYYLNDAGYRQMIEDGLDPHAWMASRIWGGDPADYSKGGTGEELRTRAKSVLFAIVYGAGAPRVSDMLGCSKDEARVLIATIKQALPGYMALAGYSGRIAQKVERDSYVTTLMGRRQPVNRTKSYVGLNALIQGSAADIMKRAVCDVTDVVGEFAAYPLLFVHDEIVVECPTEEAERCLAAMEAAMANGYQLAPALAVTGTIATHNYAEAK